MSSGRLDDILCELFARGIQVWAEGSTLRFRAPKGAWGADLRAELTRNKAGLIARLGQRKKHAPPSSAQMRMWFLDQLSSRRGTDNVPMAWRWLGPLDRAALEQSLSHVVKRHETLRTVILKIADQAVQVISLDDNITLPQVDLTALKPLVARAQARRLLNREAVRVMNLETGPLRQPMLLALAAEEHVLSLTLHHIISDGWSQAVLEREIEAHYGAFCRGALSPLPPLPLQYADFAVAELKWLQSGRLHEQLKYWRAQLADPPRSTAPRSDHPRGAARSFFGRVEPIEIPAPLTMLLEGIGKSLGASLYMTLLAAFVSLLNQETGQEDILVGLPIASRNRQELEALIGYFVNTLVLRNDLTGEPSFRELLLRVRETALDAYAHRDIPFEKLVEELQPVRDTRRNPLFDVTFNLHNAPAGGITLPGYAITPFDVDSQRAHFDLAVDIIPTAEGLEGQVLYSAELYETTTVRRFVRHFVSLLNGVVSDPTLRLGELPTLDAAERHQLVAEWNDTLRSVDEKCLHQLFQDQVVRTPEAVALDFDDVQISYRELGERADQLASYLQGLGVGPEVLVGVAVEPSRDQVTALLSILKAGGAYVPLDPSHPQKRLQFMIEDSGIRILLIQEHLATHLPLGEGLKVVRLDTGASTIATAGGHKPRGGVSPDNAAYVIYTSGSTGRPKGAIITHRAVSNCLRWVQQSYRLAASDRVLQKTPFSFDVSVREIFWPLTTGARLIVARPEERRDVAYLVDLIRRHSITTLNFVPSMLQAFLRQPGARHCTALQRIICGGEAFPASLLLESHTRLPAGVRLYNHYGPTEATIHSTYWPCDRHSTQPVIPIGRPLTNCSIHVVDTRLRPLPIGAAGELCISGVQLARGYEARPALTAEKFIPDPLGRGRLYRTGDLARYRIDGALEFLGRIDHQVKIRGNRVEPGEIETALLSHPRVREAVVLASADGKYGATGEGNLVAYIAEDRSRETGTGPPMPSLSQSQLRAFVAERLPSYMIPAAFVVVEDFPCLPSGKPDRRILARTGGVRVRPSADHVAPRNLVEATMAAIWSDVLDVKAVGIYDNFFELGGHSLLATQVVSRVRQDLETELPLRSLFTTPTVARLAEEIERALRQGAAPERPPLVPAERDGLLPLSFAQQRLWFLDQLLPGKAMYNMPASLRLRGAVDLSALEGALQEIVRRHEALRTSFPVHEGEPFQLIFADAELALTVVDLTRHPDTVRRLLTAEALRPFDLRRGPLVRSLLLRLGAQEHVLFLNLHHIVSDGWSQGVLHRELAALYEAFSQGRSSPLPELPIQYADFAVWQREWLAGVAQKSSLEAWSRRFAGLVELKLPTDRPRTVAVTGCRGAAQELAVPAGVAGGLRRLSRRHGASLYMTLLAGFMALLSRLSGQREVVVGSPVANRNYREIEGLIGFFVNMMVMRGSLSESPAEGATDDGSTPSDAPSFSTLLARVRHVVLEGFAFQDVPFDQLARQLSPERDIRLHPLFQVTFALQNTPRSPWTLPGLHIDPFEVEARVARFDLELFMWEQEEALEGSLVYNTDLFDATTAERFISYLSNLLRGAVERPELRLDELPLEAAAERHQLLVEWNDRRVKYPREACLHQLFEAQVERTPEATAVVFDDEALSYRGLDRRANQLAHELRRRGVGPEIHVGVCLERSLAMVVAMLGVLKAGGAYLPLDPESPRERLAFLVQDAGCRIVVSGGTLVECLPEAATALDTEAPYVARNPETKPPEAAAGENAAYLIYTSGSTGEPKGVVNVHRAIAHYLRLIQAAYPLAPQDRTLHKAPSIFDAALREVLWPLTAGARLYLAPPDAHRDPRHLLDFVHQHGITVLGFVPSMLPYFLDELDGRGSTSIHRVICSGEVLPPTLRKRFHQLLPEAHLLNSYGPAEAAVATVTWPVDPRDERPQVPIGRGTPNTSTYLLDARGRSVPLGAVGEIHLAGDQLARGYLGRPRLTAEAFVPNPLGGRLYRTGDLARYRGDGALLFVGRRDLQVKVRGMRVEPGEIEAVLRRHPAVGASAVVVREENGTRQLLAYAVESRAFRTEQQRQQVYLWQQVHENLHRGDAGGIAGGVDRRPAGTGGWNSSFTGQPIPVEEMDEWVLNTVKRILVSEPRRVLEIGCGTGLLLERIAPHGSLYVGTDISSQALGALERRLALSEGHLPHVRLLRKEADDFEGLETTFDTVVLNSVTQYLPSVEYLLRVLSGAVAALEPGGTLFVGDVRSLPLLDAFCALVELYRAPESLTPHELRQWAQWRHRREEELVIDPAFFLALRRALPRIRRVRILPKDGRFHNELNLFRYDVVLHLDEIGGPAPVPETFLRLDWPQVHTREGLRQRLLRQECEAVWLQQIPNARLVTANRLLAQLDKPDGNSTLADLRRALLPAATEGVEPDDLRALGEELSYHVELSWAASRSDGSYDAFLWRSQGRWVGAQPPGAEKPWRAYANDPLHEQTTRVLVPQLREHLRESLPEYMLPASIELLGELPSLPSGKVDRARLSRMSMNLTVSGRHGTADSFVPPRGQVEETLAAIWSEVIGVEPIGTHDNFFELGGDSILSIQVVAKARQLGLQLTPRDIFERQSIAELAQSTPPPEESGREVSADQGLVTGPLPMTPIQQAFFEWDLAEPWHYNQAILLETHRPLKPALVTLTLAHLLHHHDALRLRFVRQEDGWSQHITDPERPVVLSLDLSRLDETNLTRAIEEASAALQASLDLERGPLVRVAWFDLGKQRCGRLLIAVHHLAVDRVSWGILLEDLENVYQQLEKRRSVSLPAKTTSLRAWAQRLLEEPASQELDTWLSFGHPVSPLPVDFTGDLDTAMTTESVPAVLDPEATRLLLQTAPTAASNRIEAVMLTALVQTLAGWTGSRSLLVELERHGREDLFGDVDLSRTVGWFTMTFPVLLELPEESEDEVQAIHQQLEITPRRGIGYGLLRYLSPEPRIRQRMASLPRPEVSLNYMGRLDRILPPRPDPLFDFANESIGPSRSQRGRFRHRLTINGGIVDSRLNLKWTFSRAYYRRSTIEDLIGNFCSRLQALSRPLEETSSSDR